MNSQALSAYTKRVLIGQTPGRQLNGLPTTYTGHIPTSGLTKPVVSDSMIGLPNDNADTLPYSPGIVEHSGALAQIAVVNPTDQQNVGTSAGTQGRAFGNSWLRLLIS